MKDAERAEIQDKVDMEQREEEGKEGTEFMRDDDSKMEKKGLAQNVTYNDQDVEMEKEEEEGMREKDEQKD